MNSTQWTLRFALCVGLLSVAAACSTDELVRGPQDVLACSGDACAGDIATADADGGADVPVQRSLNFYVETAKGNLLEGTTTSGALGIGHDKYPGTGDKGVQIDVVVNATNVPDGTPVGVLVNGKDSGVSSAIVSGKAVLPKVTLPCTGAPVVLTVSAAVVGEAKVEAGKTLVLDCGVACVATLEPPPACLIADGNASLAGFQYTFIVKTTTTDCTHAYLTYVDAEGKPQQSEKIALAGASAPIEITLSASASNLIGKIATVTAHVEDQSQPDRLAGQSAELPVILTTEKPAIAIAQPALIPGQITQNDDIDLIADGVQVLLVGTATTMTPADIGKIKVSVNGAPVGDVTQKVDGSFQLPLSFTKTDTYAVKVTATNGCGLSNTITVSYSVFVTTAKLKILDPAPDQVLLAKDDGVPTTDTVYDAAFLVSLQQVTQDSEISVYCKKAGSNYLPDPVGHATVIDATAATLAVPVTLDIDVLGNDVVCYAIDNAPNPSNKAEVAFKVGLPPPCLNVKLPVDNKTVPAASLQVALTGANLNAVPIKARLTSAAGVAYDEVTVGTMLIGSLVAKLPLSFGAPATQLPDGTYTLTFEATDSWGNLASESACSNVVRTLTIDSKGPDLALALPAKATLTLDEDPDTLPLTPGYQTNFALQATDAASVCLSVNGVALGCKPAAPGVTTVQWSDVTLQPGANLVEPSAVDAVGNPSLPQSTVITLLSDVPIVQFVSPPGSISTVLDTMNVTVKVTDSKSGAPVGNAVLEVLINGAVTVPPTVATQGSNGEYTFAVSGLAQASKSVQVGAALSAAPTKLGYSSVIQLTYKMDKPVITITSPADGATFNLASPACVPGVPGCITDVAATTQHAEEGSNAVLTVTCAGTPTQYPAQVANGAVAFAGVTLTDQQVCTLVAQVTDLPGQTATSAVHSVTVDRTAPTFGNVASPVGKTGAQITLVAVDDVNNDPSDGMQVNMQIQVTGLPKGATATLDVLDDNGKTTATYKFVAGTAIGDKLYGIASFGFVSLPDGTKVKLIFGASDLAGNTAAKTVVAQVISNQPEVRINEPSHASEGKVCTVSADCGSSVCAAGTCALPWNKLTKRLLTVTTTGLPNGADVRLCSNTAGLSGADCATAGYKVIATATVQTSAATIPLESLTDGIHHIIAEISMLPTIPWVASTTSPYAFTRARSIALDTVPPVMASLTPPTASGVPANCLSDKLQSVADFGLPGGKFAFGVATANEDATISLLINNLPVAAAKTAAKAASIAVTIPTEDTVTVSAIPTDWVGNIGDETALPPFTVNTVPPTGAFAAPAKAILIIGDSLDIKIISNDVDVQGQSVKLVDGGVVKGARTIETGVALFTNALYAVLTDGLHTLQAVLSDTCGNTTTIATVPASITVDTQAPQVLFSLPGPGALFTDAEDAAPATGGYQVDAEFSTVDAATWTLDLGYDCDAAFANCVGYQPVASGAVTNPGAKEPKVPMTIPFGNTENYSVRISTVDSHGNPAVAARGFKVQLSGCLVQLKGLPASGGFNTQSCAVKGQNCPSITVPVTASFVGPCGTVTAVELRKAGALVASKAPSDFAAAFDLDIVDGDKVGVEAIVLADAAQQGSSGSLQVVADLSNPVLQFTAGPVLSEPTPASGAAALYGKAKDLSPATPGHQLHAQLQITDAGLAGGKLLALSRSTGGAAVTLEQQNLTLPVALAGTAETIDIQFATLAEDVTNVVTATVQDALGNVGTATFTAMIDWTPPAAVVLNAFGVGDLNPRRPLARLSFTTVGDNGTVGKASSYDVRYSRKPIASEADFTAACDGKALALANVPTPSAAGATDAIILEGPDPRLMTDPCKFASVSKYDPLVDNGDRSYYFAVRVTDAAGNKSPVSAALATDGLRLRYARMNLSGTFALPGGGCATAPAGSTCDMKQRTYPVGDLNADGFADMAVGGGLSQPLCILYGRASNASGVLADIDLSTTSGPNHFCLPNTFKACPSCTAGGLGAPVGRGRDLNGDGITDLVVGFGSGTGAIRGVMVFLGRDKAQLSGTPAVVINNVSGGSTFGVRRVTTISNFNGDVSATTGLPLSDIAFTSGPVATGPYAVAYDRVFVVPGSAGWTEGSTTTIDLYSGGDRTAANIANIHLSNAQGTQVFGFNLLSIGNMLPDNGGSGKQYDDLAIAQNATPQQLMLLKGRAWTGAVEIQLSSNNSGVFNDGEAVRIYPNFMVQNSFGYFMESVEFDGDSLPDLAVQHQLTGAIGNLYWLRGKSVAGKEGKHFAIYGAETSYAGDPNLFGVGDGGAPDMGYRAALWHVGLQGLGNFTDRPGANHVDLVYGAPTYSPTGSKLVNVRLNLMRPASPIPTEAAFEYDDLSISNPFTPADTAWGVRAGDQWGGQMMSPLGDFNGDGFVDLAIGSVDGTLVIVY